jgi:type IV pilus assembly protein PilM
VAFQLPFWSSELPPLIGLDIGSASVKLVEIGGLREQDAQLEHYAIEPLPRGAVVDGNIDRIEIVVDAIKRVWQHSGSRIRNVALALPTSAAITRRIALPANLREDELEIQVESEASQYIPFRLDEVSLDFQVLGPLANAPDDVEVLVVASRREKVEDRVAVAEAAGLQPVILDVESFAMQSAVQRLIERLPERGEGMIVALFHIGANSTTVMVMHDGEAIYEREQPFGGQLLTSEIARAYGLAPEEAEAKKCRGDLPAGYVVDVLKPFVDNAATEVMRALQFFFTSTPFTRVDQIMLAGGSGSLPGLPELLAERAQVPVSVISPFEGMGMGRRIRDKQLRNDAAALLTPCGLALRRFTG